jgi:hypothetical protein
MGVRTFLVALLAFVLLVWGPIEPSWRFPLAIRAAYLITLPLALWLILAGIWRMWHPDAATEARLRSVIAGAVAAAFFVGAVLAANQKSHFQCTQSMWTRDGSECVGDYVREPGPDQGRVALLVMFGCLSVWVGIQPHGTSSE